MINCDAAPFVPTGWSIKKHKEKGWFHWDPMQVNLFLSGPQRVGKVIGGRKLRRKLRWKPVLNACVLDYLLAQPHIIPESWKQDEQGRTRDIFFWGTIYRDSRGYLCVRCLSWGGGAGWDWRYRWLFDGWGDQSPTALRAS